MTLKVMETECLLNFVQQRVTFYFSICSSSRFP